MQKLHVCALFPWHLEHIVMGAKWLHVPLGLQENTEMQLSGCRHSPRWQAASVVALHHHTLHYLLLPSAGQKHWLQSHSWLIHQINYLSTASSQSFSASIFNTVLILACFLYFIFSLHSFPAVNSCKVCRCLVKMNERDVSKKTGWENERGNQTRSI